MSAKVYFVFDKAYIEIPVPEILQTNNDEQNSNIVCCVDKSGSMHGDPINQINEILNDIYTRTQTNFPVITYNNTAELIDMEHVSQNRIQAGGGTRFCALYEKISEYLQQNMTMDHSIIIMTDGQDYNAQTGKEVERLRLLAQNYPKNVVFHVIGLGNTNERLLEFVRTLGKSEGTLRYAVNAGNELSMAFDDIFNLAISKEFEVIINNENYFTNTNTNTISMILDIQQIENISIEDNNIDFEIMENFNNYIKIKALNIFSPNNEDEVRQILNYLHTIDPKGSLKERMEIEKYKLDINERMMEYLDLFTQMKESQVPERVKLQLNSLRHESKFAALDNENKLSKRVNKNVQYFIETDIDGILTEFKNDITENEWQSIKDIRNDWICTYSQDDIYSLMKKDHDNILCIGVEVKRNENCVTDPVSGLELVNVSNTLISYSSFIEAIMHTKNNTVLENTENDNTDLNNLNDQYCIVGATHEKINAVIPLYIHEQHMKRIRILEGIWLGYMYTFNSYGYDKNQEIGLLKLFFDMHLMQNVGTEFYQRILNEMKQLCTFIIEESEGFKTAFGSTKYDKYVQTIHERTIDNVKIPLIIGYLKNDMHHISESIYFELIKRFIANTNNISNMDTIKLLMYGQENNTIIIPDKKFNPINVDDPDIVEQTFIDFFHDQMNEPYHLIPESSTQVDRKQIVETDVNYLKSLFDLENDETFIEIQHFYSQIGFEFNEDNIDFDKLRKEIIMQLYWKNNIPRHVNYSNLLLIMDENIQGKMDNIVEYNFSEENMGLIVYKSKACKTLEGFGGLLRKYCPKRYGEVFDRIVYALLHDSEVTLRQEKLICLLTNEIGYSEFYELKHLCWQPYFDIDKIYEIVGTEKMNEIETQNRHKNKLRYHVYRSSNKPNYHGHSNWNPNPYQLYEFSGYNNNFIYMQSRRCN